MTIEETQINVGADALSPEDINNLDADYKALQESGDIVTAPVTTPATENVQETDEEREAREAAEDAATELSEEEREAIRERRRKERIDKRKFRKEKEDSYKREIESLRRQVGDMNEWKNSVEQRRVQSGVAQLDKALKDSLEAVEVAKRAIREATETSNGEALVDAQELYYAARRRAENIHGIRQQLNQRMQQRPQQNIDQAVVTHAQSWMQGKDWYDPQGKDPDSRVALTIDNSLAEEGWDPRTAEYWEELDGRLKKYLPHRYNSGYTERKRDEIKPPTGGSSQTRGSTNSSNFTLSPERVRAMKEAGYWDDPDKRKTMIKRYMEQDRAAKNS